MPLLASNFTSNLLYGTTIVAGGWANVDLTVDAFAFEGDKTFAVKLRKDSTLGQVIGTSAPITIKDYTTIVGLSANISTVNEGNLVQFTLTTTNVVNYTNVAYSVFPATANVTADDFVANTGYITIINNVGTFALKANADVSLMDESEENFRVQIRDRNSTNVFISSNITIGDVSRGVNVVRFVESAVTTAEGGTLTLTFTATNANNVIIYYSTDGNATTSTFTGGNTGSFILNGLSNTFTLLPTGVPYGTTQNFTVKLRSDTPTGPVIATSNNLIVVDSSIAYMTATGGNVATISGYKVHTFNTSGILNVTYLGALGQLEILSIGGGGSGGAGWPGPSQGGSGGGAGGYVYVPAVSTVLGNLTVTVGAGGVAGGGSFANNGSNTSVTGPNFSNILSVGGGYGGHPSRAAKSGGSGGGTTNATISQGMGYGFPSPTQQGYPGGGTGNGPVSGWHAGGGGAGGYGGNAYTTPPGSRFNGDGGVGLQSSISGSAVYYAGGGGGGSTPNDGNYTPAPGGLGGGGRGGPGTVNTGGGGGGGGGNDAGGNGGSGIVIIRYPYAPPITVSNVLTTANTFLVGSNITFTVNAQNANLLTLYYSTDGNVTASNFINGNIGSFVANASGGIVTLQANTNIPVNESRSFRLQIRQDSTSGFISGSSANVIIDGFASQISATGGTITTSGGYRTHTFTNSANLIVTKVPQVQGNVEILMVAGGGGPGYSDSPFAGGGGGAGGVLYRANATLTAQQYPIVVGGGGGEIGNGTNTTGFSVIALGGGSGGSGPAMPTPLQSGNSGGSGGGASRPGIGGSSTQGSFAGWFKYGNSGGSGAEASGSYGGGGAGGVGQGGPSGPGGGGVAFNISGSPVTYAAGGSSDIYGPAPAVSPGTGNGGWGSSGGPGLPARISNGSPGIVIVRYPYS
jgi:hypothetical protein